jgi:rhamnogalacturonan endolyase
MNLKYNLPLLFLFAGILFIIKSSPAQRIMENMDRGTIAIKASNGIFLSWRLLATDPQNISFNVYRTG